MVEEWFQLWVELPYIGKQWGGWLRSSRLIAQGLAETFQTSAASAVGAKWTILDQTGAVVQPVLPGLPGIVGIPGLTY